MAVDYPKLSDAHAVRKHGSQSFKPYRLQLMNIDRLSRLLPSVALVSCNTQPPSLSHLHDLLTPSLFVVMSCNEQMHPTFYIVSDVQILAKLASGMHKPSQQTVVPMAAIPGLLQDLPIPKLRQLGGKFGDELMASLNIKTVGEVLCEATVWQLLSWSTEYACAGSLCHAVTVSSAHVSHVSVSAITHISSHIHIPQMLSSRAFKFRDSTRIQVLIAALLLLGSVTVLCSRFGTSFGSDTVAVADYHVSPPTSGSTVLIQS